MDLLTVSLMTLDNDTNVVVVMYKGAIPYSLYKNDGI